MGRKQKEVLLTPEEVDFKEKDLEEFVFMAKGNILPRAATLTAWIKVGIEIGKWKTVKEACKELKMSTSSYYSYRDKVKLITEERPLEDGE